MQVEGDNEAKVPSIVEQLSDDKGEEPIMVDLDREASSSVPQAEFRDVDNPNGIAGVEQRDGDLYLRRRPQL